MIIFAKTENYAQKKQIYRTETITILLISGVKFRTAEDQTAYILVDRYAPQSLVHTHEMFPVSSLCITITH